MNVEIGTEAAQFPEKEYINGILLAVQSKTKCKRKLSPDIFVCKYTGYCELTMLRMIWNLPKPMALMAWVHGLINYIDTKAKCHHLKNLLVKGLCGWHLSV